MLNLLGFFYFGFQKKIPPTLIPTAPQRSPALISYCLSPGMSMKYNQFDLAGFIC
jgi:hypothetical protein